jgi:hypothetical protein
MSEPQIFGNDLFGEPIKQDHGGLVAEKFLFPPFSIFDARSGEWQERKRAWIATGIKSELGRGDDLTFNGAAAWQKKKSLTYAIPTQRYDPTKMMEEYYSDEAQKLNTSIFDPVLCELAYRWFSPEGGQVIDPFAGGSVRGIIACRVGRKYWGCDLRKEQIEANIAQIPEVCPDHAKINPIEWVTGDSIDTLDGAPEADFLFSCPPYGDLEVYSNDPHDLSAMKWHDFVSAYRLIILKAVKKLKENRFACFVVGDFRDDDGYYRNFVGETVIAFLESGMKLYNEAIIMTSVGSASMRVTRQFNGGRKLCKTHQNVLVFCKGDWKKASNNIGKGEFL